MKKPLQVHVREAHSRRKMETPLWGRYASTGKHAAETRAWNRGAGVLCIRRTLWGDRPGAEFGVSKAAYERYTASMSKRGLLAAKLLWILAHGWHMDCTWIRGPHPPNPPPGPHPPSIQRPFRFISVFPQSLMHEGLGLLSVLLYVFHISTFPRFSFAACKACLRKEPFLKSGFRL